MHVGQVGYKSTGLGVSRATRLSEYIYVTNVAHAQSQ